ncbi:VWA domain-containing protein [Nonlabens sp. SCSIO 43208]|uniref:VWA domain-containing protein n=1 Tax=Nonlabens sp. SCSIO 43208 TaxID=2793009 RepID=UPI003D6A13A9
MTSSSKEQLQEFLDFGVLYNREQRSEIVATIDKWRLITQENTVLNDATRSLLKEFFSNGSITRLLKQDASFKDQITEEILKALEESPPEEIEDQFQEDRELLQQWKDGKKLRFRESDHNIPVSKEYRIHNKEIESKDKDLQTSRIEQIRKFQNDLIALWKKQIKPISNSAIAVQLNEAGYKTKENELIADLNGYSYTYFEKYWKKNNRHKDFIRKKYKKRQIDLNKLDLQFKKIIALPQSTSQKEIDRLKNERIRNLEEQLDLAAMQAEIDAIDKWRNDLVQQLEEHVKKILDLIKKLNPILQEILPPGRLWDLSHGLWHEIDTASIDKYAALLEENKHVKELAALLGRLRLAGIAVEKEEMQEMFFRPEDIINPHGKAEVMGIKESNDLNYALPGEMALLETPETENIFLKKFAEKKIQTLELIDRNTAQFQENRTITVDKEIPQDKGPFLIAVDTSGSMHGTPELMAKLIALAIAKEASKDDRPMTIISFSTSIKTIELNTKTMDIAQLATFLGHSFHGGTDIDPALEYAIDTMKSDTYKNADLLMITDGVFPSLDGERIKEVKKLQKKKNRFHCMNIGSSSWRSMDWCDNLWTVDGSSGSLMELVKDLKVMVK